MDSRHDNLRAWLLCAPAAATLLALNVWPACLQLISSPPRPLMAELSGWAISSLVVGAQTLMLCGAILLIEVPLAVALALRLRRRAGARPATPALALAALGAGLGWRLLFGGTLGFASSGLPTWSAVLFETWRTLPLATFLLTVPLRRAAPLADAAAVDGADRTQTLLRVDLPACRGAILALAALHAVDLLRAVQAPWISVAAGDRAAWTILVALVALLALPVASRRRTCG